MDRLVDCAVTTFPVVRESIAMSETLAICGESRLAVVVDRDGAPLTLMTRRDLQSARDLGASTLADPETTLPPTVLAQMGVELSELFSYNVVPAFAVGARGVIFVSEQGAPVGVLSLDDLLRHLTAHLSSDRDAPILLRTFTDYFFSRDPAFNLDLLDGIVPLYRGPRATEILVRCRRCAYLNRLAFLSPKALTSCQRPDGPSHTLSLP